MTDTPVENVTLTKGQRLARMDRYTPADYFFPQLVNFAEIADILYLRLAASKDRQVNMQLRTALSKLSVSIDWYIHVIKKDIVGF